MKIVIRPIISFVSGLLFLLSLFVLYTSIIHSWYRLVNSQMRLLQWNRYLKQLCDASETEIAADSLIQGQKRRFIVCTVTEHMGHFNQHKIM